MNLERRFDRSIMQLYWPCYRTNICNVILDYSCKWEKLLCHEMSCAFDIKYWPLKYNNGKHWYINCIRLKTLMRNGVCRTDITDDMLPKTITVIVRLKHQWHFARIRLGLAMLSQPHSHAYFIAITLSFDKDSNTIHYIIWYSYLACETHSLSKWSTDVIIQYSMTQQKSAFLIYLSSLMKSLMVTWA